MASLREKLAALDTDAALRLVADARPMLFAKVAELRAQHLQGGGELTDRTRDSYASDARRVADAGGNPMALAGTAASFRKLRAACLWKAREDLRECLARADRARKKGDSSGLEALCISDESMANIEQRLLYLASLKYDPSHASRRDKTHMQRHKLGRLPADWISRVHARTRNGKYGEAVAVGILIPVRPEEIANRIRIKIDASGALLFEVSGSKLRDRGSGIASHVEGIGQHGQVLDTIAALNDFINKPGPKRADAVRNAQRLVRMLGAHMARLRDLMQAHRSMQAMLHAMHSAGAEHLPRTAPAFGRVRVIRPPSGADNAASGPLEISGNKPTAWDTEARRGGEAKEAGALRQSGEAGR